MQGEAPHIRLKLDTNEPIALGDFVGSFVGIGNQFEKFVASEYPSLKGDSEIFVQDVRDGCVVADMIVYVGAAVTALNIPGMIDTIDKGQILARFVGDLKRRLEPYLKGGRHPEASKSDLSDFLKQVRGITRDPNSKASLEAAVFEDGKRQVRAALRFTSSEAKEAEHQISEHRKDLESKTGKDYGRVLLRFVRPSTEDSLGKRRGERAIIEKIHPKPLPVLYVSDLAEERIHHEMLQEGNVFKKLFDVDVNVERDAAGKPLAYRITAIHAVIEGGDEDSET